jgi:divalent metal cation (Fe/Co/Zn/Cd) transporter
MASQVAFLAGGLFAGRRAAARAHLAASLLLALAGWSLLALGVSELASAERPVLGDLVVFGHAVWRGWPAIGALLWSALPALLLRRAKLRLATELRDEGARAGVETNRVDFVTALAAIAGVGGVGAGWWWADAVAAVAISIDVLCGGAKRLRRAIGELVETPAALRVAA